MTQGVKKTLVLLMAFTIWFLAASRTGLAFNEPPAVGQRLPTFELPFPHEAEAKTYLGLSGTGRFTIPQIQARVVIIQIFSMYCPVCQKEAFRVNELYQAIQKRKDLKDKIKLVGIGTGNTDFEVGFYQEKYKVPFPLFSDADESIYEILGELRTPYYIAVRINRDGSDEVFYSKLGQFRDTRSFLNRILMLSGL
jgi:peroxiredoxin